MRQTGVKRQRKKLWRKPRVLSIEQRREMLRGVTWRQFLNSREPDTEILRIDNLRFKAGMGLFLGQPAVAIVNGKEFIVVQYIKDANKFLAEGYSEGIPRVLDVNETSSVLGEAMDLVADYDPRLMDKYVVGPKLKTNRGAK